MQQVLVIGDGILGRLICGALRDAGAKVTQVVGRAPRASDASLVWLNVSSASDEAYARLRLASMRRWQELAEKQAAPVDVMGALLWEDGLDAGQEAARLSAMGWRAEAVDGPRFAQLAPGVVPPPDEALYLPDEAACDPADIMDWAGGCLQGVTRLHAEVQALVDSGGRITGVRLSDGGTVAADHVVIAAGVGCVDLLSPLGIEVPLRHAPGMLFRTAPVARVTGPVQATPVTDFWQDAQGRLIVATAWDEVLNDAAPQAALDTLDRLRALMPGIGTPAIETLSERNRPVPADGFPLVGGVMPGATLVVTHSGMTLAPVLADCIAAEVTEVAPPHDLSPFRPARLCKGLA